MRNEDSQSNNNMGSGALGANAPGRVVVSASSRLLSLSGELRNTIYDYCTEDGLLSTCQSPSENVKGFFRGLTQVCRQLRAEFRPLYLDRTQVRLDCAQELDHYLNTFYPYNTTAVLEDYRGDIVIPLGTQPHTQVTIARFDLELGPALRLASVAPNLRFQFTREPQMYQYLDRLMVQLNALLVDIRSQTETFWRTIIDRVMLDLELYATSDYSVINFVMNESEANCYKDHIAAWWARGPKPLAYYQQLRVSYGMRYSDRVKSKDEYDRTWKYLGAGQWYNQDQRRGIYVYTASKPR